MVMILLNLSYIPDEIVQSVDFTKAGWSERFKNSMDEYKAAFKEKTGKEWAYQDRDVEDDYMKFKADKDKIYLVFHKKFSNIRQVGASLILLHDII